MSSPHLRAVVFDVRVPLPDRPHPAADPRRRHPGAAPAQIGGVVSKSPFLAIAAYERERGLPDNYINCAM